MGAPLLVVTDLDGSLLDEETYAYDAARPALAALGASGVPLVLASSKTRGEMEPLDRALGLRSPLIVENGGALLIPAATLSRPASGAYPSGDYDLVPLGVRRPALLAALASIAAETGARLRGFSALTPRELERVTGLSRAAARLAREREWDEPLLIEDPAAVGLVAAAARRRGLRLSQGGRFHHLTGATDKGWALRLLLGLLASEGRRYATVGLGDCGNDLPMLEAVDRPILIPRHAGVDDILAARLPRVERAPAPGPAGWNAAVLAVLGGERLPGAAGGRSPGLRC